MQGAFTRLFQMQASRLRLVGLTQIMASPFQRASQKVFKNPGENAMERPF